MVHVSPQTIHSRVLDESPPSHPGRGTPSRNTYSITSLFVFTFLWSLPVTMESFQVWWFHHMCLRFYLKPSRVAFGTQGRLLISNRECQSLSRVWLFVTPWTAACQVSLSMGFSRQEYCRGLSFSSPGNLSNPEIEPGSPTSQADSLPSEPPGKPITLINMSWRKCSHLV